MSQFPALIAVSSLNGSNGFRIEIDGSWISAAGDVNGDGFADFIIGAPGESPHGLSSGASYMVFGKASGFAATLLLSSLNGSNGFKISGEAEGDGSGGSVASAGDVNGDGFDDILIGAGTADPHGLNSGAVYVVFGKASGFAANLNLSSLNGSNGFQINGEAAGDYAGGSLGPAGDINGDGFADILVVARGADPNGNYSSATYVVFGKASGFGANLELSALNGSNGTQINSPQTLWSYQGWYVASPGDVNGDGFDDRLWDPDRSNSSIHPQALHIGAY